MTRDTMPPGAESLKQATERQRASNDALEKTLSDPPLLTDAHRIACCRELWALHIARGFVHMDQTVSEYERVAREKGKA